jgi:hypothetical protein
MDLELRAAERRYRDDPTEANLVFLAGARARAGLLADPRAAAVLADLLEVPPFVRGDLLRLIAERTGAWEHGEAVVQAWRASAQTSPVGAVHDAVAGWRWAGRLDLDPESHTVFPLLAGYGLTPPEATYLVAHVRAHAVRVRAFVAAGRLTPGEVHRVALDVNQGLDAARQATRWTLGAAKLPPGTEAAGRHLRRHTAPWIVPAAERFVRPWILWPYPGVRTPDRHLAEEGEYARTVAGGPLHLVPPPALPPWADGFGRCSRCGNVTPFQGGDGTVGGAFYDSCTPCGEATEHVVVSVR